MITSQFVVNGNARQCEISRAFGTPLVSVKRAVRRYRERGPAGFYAARRGRRGATVLTAEVIEKLEGMLEAGVERAVAARELGLKPDTVAKAMRGGRVGKKSPQPGMVAARGL